MLMALSLYWVYGNLPIHDTIANTWRSTKLSVYCMTERKPWECIWHGQGTLIQTLNKDIAYN